VISICYYNYYGVPDNDSKSLRKLLRGLKQAKGSQHIRDLDKIAAEFGCRSETTSSDENRVYYPPHKDMGLVNVAVPHRRGDAVLKNYVSRFIRMLEEIADRKSLEEGKGEGSRPDDPTCGPATGNRGDQVSSGV